MHFGFSFVGLIIFLLPMMINMVYVIYPPKNNIEEDNENKKASILEIIENSTRIAYVILFLQLYG